MSRAAGPGCCHRALRRVAPRSPAEDRCRLVSSLVGWSGAPSIRRRFRLGNRSRMRCPASDRAGVGGGAPAFACSNSVRVRGAMDHGTPDATVVVVGHMGAGTGGAEMLASSAPSGYRLPTPPCSFRHCVDFSGNDCI